MNERKPTAAPFVQVPKYVVEEAPKAIAVYATLRLYSNWETGVAYPAIESVASRLGVGRRTVERRIAELEAIGAIRKRSRKSEGKTNEYEFPRQRFDLEGTSAVTYPSVSPVVPVRQDSATNVEELNVDHPNGDGRLRRRDRLWEVFVEIHGEPATKSERGKYNRIVKTLREADVDETEYPSLVAAYCSKYESLQPAAATVAQRIGELRHFVRRGPIRSASLEQLERDRRFAELETNEAIEGGS